MLGVRSHSLRIALALVALVAALVLASCGGDDKPTAAKPAGGDKANADPKAVALVEAASGPNTSARSGRIDGSVEITLTGVKDFAEPVVASVSGPFSYRNGSALPDYELDVGMRNYGVELSSVGGRSYVTIGTTGYRMPDDIRGLLVRKSARGRNGLTRTIEQLGIAPWRWETQQQFAGTEQLDGVKVQKVTTGFTAGRILKDANTLLEVLGSLTLTRVTGVPPVITRSARRVIVSGVTFKNAASWIGIEDKVLRKTGFEMKFKIPKAQRHKVGGISSGTVVAGMNITEVGKPQKISPPQELGSFADFKLALDALGDFQEAR